MSKKLDLNDFIGKKYGCLTIIGIAEPNTSIRQSKVKVKCDCGNESVKVLENVLHSLSRCSKECGIFVDDQIIKMVDKYIGKKYNHLTIRSFVRKIENSIDSGSDYRYSS